ncbi:MULTISPECIES: putative zinc ribbon protein [Klebsiella]|uniref:putative zinc ribbon protein n=2 Tax=Enterobacterales TaxID=91347 RepID=UPI000F4DE315|nr:hypothetical protein EGY21_20120 [Klebsiella oxytoca]MRG02866.1 hypothetical protein [Klebsiella oxytoca]MRG41665.1 hypothetical protein [Klebsiella oxytoca]
MGQAFLQRLCALVDSMDTISSVTRWFCVWCNTHYQGEKHCKTCKTGIYSISHGDWCWNYNQKENASEISDHTVTRINHHHQTAFTPS